ncbi:MAG: bifunctional adenosylcobinamide kinase/adenosylcobinamide-phosphate guanylyltransferase [Thermodesulfobacteriota bacterium]
MNESTSKEIILVMGGARSGKSSWALNYVQDRYETCLFIATAEVKDEEMAERVRLHQAARGPQWRLLEEPLLLGEALQTKCERVDAVLVDCLTVWLSNVLLKEGKPGVVAHEQRLIRAVSEMEQTVVMVSNEVGMGIVPEHPLGREFRDLAGFLNQKMAQLADRVVLTMAGLPQFIK